MASGNAETLLQQGIQAAQSGNKAAAKELFVQALKLDPRSELGWMWMVQVVESDQEREFCLGKILEINPNNQQAQQALAQLQQPPMPDWAQAPPAQEPEPEIAPPTPPADPFGAAANPFDAGEEDTFDIPLPNMEDDDIFGPSEEELFGGTSEPREPAQAADSFDFDWPEDTTETAADEEELGGSWPDVSEEELGLTWSDEDKDDWGASETPSQETTDWPDDSSEEAAWDWDEPLFEGEEESTSESDDGLDDLRTEAEGESRKRDRRKKPIGFIGRVVRLLIAAFLLVVIVGVSYFFILPQITGTGDGAPPATTNRYEGANFSFEYPSNWQVDEESTTEESVTLTRGEIDLSADTPPDEYAIAEVRISPNPGQSPQELVEEMRTAMTMEDDSITIENLEEDSAIAGEQESYFATFLLSNTEEEQQGPVYTYIGIVDVGDQILSLYLVSSNQADLEVGKQILNSLSVPEPTEVPEMADATQEATSDATEEATMTTEPEATETPAPTEVAMLPEGENYESEIYTLRYPADWIVAAETQEDDGTETVSISAELYPMDEPPSDPFTLANITTGPTGGNPAPVWAELLRATAVEQVALWDETELDAETALTLVDLNDQFIIGELEGVFEYYTIDRAEDAATMHVYSGVVTLEDNQGFNLLFYTTEESERETAEAVLKSVQFTVMIEEATEEPTMEPTTEEATAEMTEEATEEPTETPTPDPEMYGPPAPPPPSGS